MARTRVTVAAARTAAPALNWKDVPVGGIATVRRAKDGTTHTMQRVFAPKGVIRIVSLNDAGFVANSQTDKNWGRYAPLQILSKTAPSAISLSF